MCSERRCETLEGLFFFCNGWSRFFCRLPLAPKNLSFSPYRFSVGGVRFLSSYLFGLGGETPPRQPPRERGGGGEPRPGKITRPPQNPPLNFNIFIFLGWVGAKAASTLTPLPKKSRFSYLGRIMGGGGREFLFGLAGRGGEGDCWSPDIGSLDESGAGVEGRDVPSIFFLNGGPPFFGGMAGG